MPIAAARSPVSVLRRVVSSPGTSRHGGQAPRKGSLRPQGERKPNSRDEAVSEQEIERVTRRMGEAQCGRCGDQLT